ncbi:hypothetical protein JTE90_001055 [Oedothorax gibbosus]|uniref:TIR domain-containing protein n=1 Tax=Oedothorax gibbosus TaxID=931172 RepID=A0AAV6UIP0_9ARAC|nr:hypothetical protein JTE90_001055 [Oedothorax gibbosus]
MDTVSSVYGRSNGSIYNKLGKEELRKGDCFHPLSPKSLKQEFSRFMAPGVAHRNSNDLAPKLSLEHNGDMHLMADDSCNLRKFGGGLVGGSSGNPVPLGPRKSIEVIGVILVDKNHGGSPDNKAVVLGTVCVENVKMSLDDLRRFMCTELPCLPANFSFLTKEGWPIARQQEHKVNASHTIKENKCICISKEFEKPRVAIVTSNGDNLGFVFTDLNINIKQLRETVEQQLKITQQFKLDYRFVERNGWPVTSNQETALSILDVMLGHIVYIHNGEKQATIAPNHTPRPMSLMYSPSNVTSELQPSPMQEVAENEHVKRKKSFKFLRPEALSVIKSRKESEKRSRKEEKEQLIKPILISYVRNEAAQYALDLKKELVLQGFSVYLDVHEIKTGSDWQDALNSAVTNCFLFIPLITSNYGKTRWTNREVKLADVLAKTIIPVNFMDVWPPPCLAIQFASTQYIQWKNPEQDHVKDPEIFLDSKHWDPVCIKRVGRQIAECFKDQYFKAPKRSPSTKEMTLNSKPQLSPREDIYTLVSDFGEESSRRIVISAHPRQRYLAQDLKSAFEKSGYEVWCSVEMMDNQMNLGSEDIATTDPNTPRNLPTIQEGDVFFNQNDLEMYSSIGDKKSHSLYREPEAYGRRPLSRLMSQFSDISQPSTLSREKLDQLKTFQQKVDQAVVIIVLVSEAYTKSAFSHQQVFYCEHRKRVVMVKCDSSPIPKWFRLLMGNDMIVKANNLQFECVLQSRVKRMINPSSSETPKDATAEAKINCLVNFFKHNLPLQDMCVYVTGSTKILTPRAEEISKAIGAELAKVERISLVTGGFFGAADITAKTFNECRENNIPEESAVVHILPMNDSEDLSAKAKQNPDGSFEAIPYGKTFFLGDSVKERETVVARLLDTCIVIEGGPGVVHEVEEFIWNDHFVIPIMSTGGAAGGQYGVPVRIFEVPPGVDDADWSVLSEKEATPEEVAKAVVNILVSLKKNSPTNTLQKPHPPLKRKSRKKNKSRKYYKEDELNSIEMMPAPPPLVSHCGIMRTAFDIRDASEISQSSSDVPSSIMKKKRSWWRRFLRLFKRRN